MTTLNEKELLSCCWLLLSYLFIMESFKSAFLSRFGGRSEVLTRDAHVEYLFLDGGRCIVPVSHRKSVLCAYARAIEAGQAICMVEVKTEPAFKWFVDLDFKGDETVEEDRIHRIIRIIQGTLPLENRKCNVATSVRSGKSGFHLVFPNAIFSRDDATSHRKSCLDDLRKFEPGIDDIFDESVYRKGVGLRMVYSRKKRAEKYTYTPAFRVSEEGHVTVPDYFDSDVRRVVFDFSIQTDQGTLPSQNTVLSVERSTTNISKSPNIHQTRATAGPAAACPCISTVLSRHFKNDDIVITGKKRDGDMTILKTNSRACLNLVHGKHKNARIYFIAELNSKEGRIYVYQRCFCACNDKNNRKSGLCKNFKKLVCDFDSKSPCNDAIVREIFQD